MNMPLDRAILIAQGRVAQQRQWIDDHGGDIIGYIGRYGSARDPEHFGDGGEAIYQADRAELAERLLQLDELVEKVR